MFHILTCCCAIPSMQSWLIFKEAANKIGPNATFPPFSLGANNFCSKIVEWMFHNFLGNRGVKVWASLSLCKVHRLACKLRFIHSLLSVELIVNTVMCGKEFCLSRGTKIMNFPRIGQGSKIKYAEEWFFIQNISVERLSAILCPISMLHCTAIFSIPTKCHTSVDWTRIEK